MCCNRRNRNRQSLAFNALQVASEKYPKRQEQKRIATSAASLDPHGTSNKYIGDETTAEPPSYEAVISDNQAAQRGPDAKFKASAPSEERKSIPSSLDDEKNVEQYQSWWQQKKAEIAARKAEKWAEKARGRGYVF
ncbi:hypothetical protein DOTSEDRAFT_74518 [Dothistroma septosporum NZE10]|uniref:Uncharacterized protein n=1 Tax=Dothistroma septosporum (strain NZE10 / CBS 128990) TaxID=675120 RepID=N1PEE0_DOTSN|nr:hypothetical protein DOTSEDRAFT_74518 [Dothistroma septosporum NZE10]